MPDKRSRRKAPARRNLSSWLRVNMQNVNERGDDGVCNGPEALEVQLSQKIFGATTRLLINRGGARALRDWLNHYLEYVAEVEAAPQPLTEGWAIPMGSAACHHFKDNGVSSCAGHSVKLPILKYLGSPIGLLLERFAPVCQACAKVVDGEKG